MNTYTTNSYGLRQKDMDYMSRLFESVPAVEKVVLFGSRATGRFEKGSDIDLALLGAQISSTDIARISHLLNEESPTLLGFDVLKYGTLKNKALLVQINKHGHVIYDRV